MENLYYNEFPFDTDIIKSKWMIFNIVVDEINAR